MGLFDWLSRGRHQTPTPVPTARWHIFREGGEIVAQNQRGAITRSPLAGARHVRIVPLTGGSHHPNAKGGGWQVAIQRDAGDELVGSPLGDWREARELARQWCDASGLDLDELTQRMFSRVGQFSPAKDN